MRRAGQRGIAWGVALLAGCVLLKGGSLAAQPEQPPSPSTETPPFPFNDDIRITIPWVDDWDVDEPNSVAALERSGGQKLSRPSLATLGAAVVIMAGGAGLVLLEARSKGEAAGSGNGNRA